MCHAETCIGRSSYPAPALKWSGARAEYSSLGPKRADVRRCGPSATCPVTVCIEEDEKLGERMFQQCRSWGTRVLNQKSRRPYTPCLRMQRQTWSVWTKCCNESAAVTSTVINTVDIVFLIIIIIRVNMMLATRCAATRCAPRTPFFSYSNENDSHPGQLQCAECKMLFNHQCAARNVYG